MLVHNSVLGNGSHTHDYVRLSGRVLQGKLLLDCHSATCSYIFYLASVCLVIIKLAILIASLQLLEKILTSLSKLDHSLLLTVLYVDTHSDSLTQIFNLAISKRKIY